MGDLEDDKREIMEAVRNAIGAALNEHKLGCPMAQNIQSLERIRADLYNGEDGKSGLSYEFRDFHSAWVQRTKDEDKAQAELLEERAALAERDRERRRNSQWRNGIVAVAMLALLGFLCQKGWDRAVILNKIADDWTRYYQNNPTPPLIVPAPQNPHKSYFQHLQSGVSSNQKPQDAGIPPIANGGNQ